MNKNKHYLLLTAGIILINAETLVRNTYSIPDFVNGILKGLGIVSFTAFIYYCLKSKNAASKEVHHK